MNDNRNAAGVVGGIAAGWASYKYLPKITQRPYGRFVLSGIQTIPESEQLKYYEAAQKAFETSGLKEKGVEIIHIDPNNVKQAVEANSQKTDIVLKKAIKKVINKMLKVLKAPPLSDDSIDQKVKKSIEKKTKPRPRWKYILFGPQKNEKEEIGKVLDSISKGENACFHPIVKNIYVNKNKMGFSTPHEMGHAINANSTTARKILSYGRGITAKFVPILLALALIKKRKPESKEEPQSEQRKKNFLKDNIGLISFACLTPTLAEEGLASINGAKQVKNWLKPKEFKKLNILNGKAWSTYLLGVTLFSVCAQFAVNIKDKLSEPKQDKNA